MSKYVNKPYLYWEHATKEIKKETEAAVKRGIKRGLKEVQKGARLNLTSRVKGANKVKEPYYDSLVQGIRYLSPRRNKEDKSEISGAVKITSNRKKGSGSFRLVFLEMGTKDRRTKKGYYRGALTPKYFFRDAQISPDKVQSYIDMEMDEAIRKLKDKT